MITTDELKLLHTELKENYIDRTLFKAARLFIVFSWINIIIYPIILIGLGFFIIWPSLIEQWGTRLFMLIIFALILTHFIISFFAKREATDVLLGISQNKNRLQKYSYVISPWILVRKVKKGKYINKIRWEALRKNINLPK